MPAVAAMEAARRMYSSEVEVVTVGLEGMVVMFVDGVEVLGDVVDELRGRAVSVVSVPSFDSVISIVVTSFAVASAVSTSIDGVSAVVEAKSPGTGKDVSILASQKCALCDIPFRGYAQFMSQ
jgi:hypothetical protein